MLHIENYCLRHSSPSFFFSLFLKFLCEDSFENFLLFVFSFCLSSFHIYIYVCVCVCVCRRICIYPTSLHYRKDLTQCQFSKRVQLAFPSWPFTEEPSSLPCLPLASNRMKRFMAFPKGIWSQLAGAVEYADCISVEF